MWNYRMFVKSFTHANGESEDEWYIGEAYYRGGNRLPYLWSGPIAPKGESKWELVEDHSRMFDAISQPAFRIDGNRIVGVVGSSLWRRRLKEARKQKASA